MKRDHRSSNVVQQSTYFNRIKGLLQAGNSSQKIIDMLQEEGLEREKAVTLISEVMDYPVRYSRMIGKRNMSLGLLLILSMGVVSIINIFIFFQSPQDSVYLPLGIVGVGFFMWGLTQYLNKKPKLNQKQTRELNELAYGVEEPEKTWDCPKCNHKNSNNTYKCTNCGYDLMS